MKYYDTLVQAIQAKQVEGYIYDFNLRTSLLRCESLNKEFNPNDFMVNAVFRFEGDSNPDDSSILYAIETTNGIKGLLVDAYGVYSDAISPEMNDKLSFDF